MLQRRNFLELAASALAAPALARAQPAGSPGSRTVRFVPFVDLGILDPVINTNALTRTHGYLVFDTLYGVAGDYSIQPQMVQGHVVEDGGLGWTLTLRDGLRFHSGEPVLARDVVASLRRWGAVDQTGATLLAATNELSAADDGTVRFRMKRPFPLLARGARQDRARACRASCRSASPPPTRTGRSREMVGSGPFRFVADERVPGAPRGVPAVRRLRAARRRQCPASPPGRRS